DRVDLSVELANSRNRRVELAVHADTRDVELFAHERDLRAMVAAARPERNRNDSLHGPSTPLGVTRAKAASRVAAIFSGVIAASNARMSASSNPQRCAIAEISMTFANSMPRPSVYGSKRPSSARSMVSLMQAKAVRGGRFKSKSVPGSRTRSKRGLPG